jgi:raffinose/stachyose/melibiose transport system substrate-binding protein
MNFHSGGTDRNKPVRIISRNSGGNDVRRTLNCLAVIGALMATTATAQEKVNLRLATVFDAAGVANWQPVLDSFMAANPDITVSMESTAGSGAAVYPDVLRTSMASGDPPDIFFMWGGTVAGPFIRAEQVLPLNSYFEEYGWKERFPPWVVTRLGVGDETYGVPYQAQGMGFFYRKDILEANGLTLPTTYAEMEAMCTTLSAAGVHCATTGGKFGWHVMRLVDWFIETGCGPDIHDGLNALTESWDQPCVVASYQKLADWIANGWLVPDFLNVAPDDSRIPLYQGKAAMILEGPWFEPAITEAGVDPTQYGFFIPPTDHEPGRYSSFPEQWMISAGSKNPDAAAKFIDFITNADTVKANPEAFGASATIGIKPDCTKRPLTCEIVDVVQSDRPAYPPTDQAFEKELMDTFFEVQDGIVAGQLTPAEGAALMQKQAEAWKAKQG